MIVDDNGEVTIINIGTPLSPRHHQTQKIGSRAPTANLLVQLSQVQDAEVGDGTTSVVILAAELLKRTNELVKMKVYPLTSSQGSRSLRRRRPDTLKTNWQ